MLDMVYANREVCYRALAVRTINFPQLFAADQLSASLSEFICSHLHPPIEICHRVIMINIRRASAATQHYLR